MAKVGSATQTGILMPGPGGRRLNALLSDLQPLTTDQLECISRARKYAMEQSFKSVIQKQVVANTQQQHQKSLQRHQALVLMCRVYVGSISFEVREETIKNVFSPYGAIKSINMSWDPITLKHKGFAFVEYEIPEAAQLALDHMNGVQVGGRQIKVGRPSNMPQAAPIIQQIQEECKVNNRIYITNIHADLSDQELTDLFDPFGKIRSCKLAMTPNVEQPQHRGYGFIEFDTEAAVTEALTMDKVDLGGQALHVCRATTPAEHLSIYGTLDSEAYQAATLNQAASNASVDDDIQLQLERVNKEHQDQTRDSNHDENHSSENGSSHELTDQSQQLQSHSFKPADGPTEPVSSSGISNILVLRNMISADDEIDDSLQLDVYEESVKHGPVTQVVIHVDKGVINGKTDEANGEGSTPADEVKIFVKYKDSRGSARAREALNGRFFAGRKVSAEHYDQQAFRLSDYSK